MRLVRRHFAFGIGHLVFRSNAHIFKQFAGEFWGTETLCLESVARNEAIGKPLAAARMCQAAAKKEPRLPPLAEQVGATGGSRWLIELMALERCISK